MTVEYFDQLIIQHTETLNEPIPISLPYKLSVKQKFDKVKIIDALCFSLPHIGREIWIEKLNQNKILLENEIVNPNTTVRSGNIITHFSEPEIEPSVNYKIQLIYSDDDLLAINKPAPLPVQPCGRFYRNNLISILKSALKNEKLKLIHRLDANTTGIVLIAKNQHAAQNLSRQFEEKTIKKTYLALVDGIINSKIFHSHQTIGEKKMEAGSRAIVEQGKIAHSEFEVLIRLEKLNRTFLKVYPHSGKTNQIRIHLANLGFPITGDRGYQDKNYFKTNPFTYPSDSLFLHAFQASFIHPNSKKNITLTAPIPDKFQKITSDFLKFI